MARDLLRRWWGLELGLTDARGGGYDRTSHATCETVRGVAAGACAKELTDLATQLAKSKERGAVARTCHAGMTIVAAPVFNISGLAGLVYATGGNTDSAAMEQGLVKTIGLSADEARAAAAAAPGLPEADVARVKDLVASAAAAVERALPTEIAPTTFS